MNTRSGQVALYLVMILMAIAVLMLSNVNMFFAVRAKNRMMNAADAAALAAARYQGYLLNRLGEMNAEHLRAAITGDESQWLDMGGKAAVRMRMLPLMGPIDAIDAANAAAREWGHTGNIPSDALSGFMDHISEIRNDTELYRRSEAELKSGNDLWTAYADRLQNALGGNLTVLPRYMEMANPGTSGLFGSWGFYDVIAAKAWCWFSIGDRKRYLDTDPKNQEAAETYPVDVPENSEVFSLHVTFKTWQDSPWEGRFDEAWSNFVWDVAGLPRGTAFATNEFVTAADQVWAFYEYQSPEGSTGAWQERWSTTFNPDNFPIAGSVKPEYDIAGCSTSVMLAGDIPQMKILSPPEEDERTSNDDNEFRNYSRWVTAEAKPLGTVEALDEDGGGVAPVTAYRYFIGNRNYGEQIFTSAQLTLMGSVPRRPGVSMEPNWYNHVKKHSPKEETPGCEYCRLWRLFGELRTSIRSWLIAHEESCHPKGGSGPMKGGYEYSH